MNKKEQAINTMKGYIKECEEKAIKMPFRTERMAMYITRANSIINWIEENAQLFEKRGDDFSYWGDVESFVEYRGWKNV
jgi:hypothetical protein